MVAFVSILGMSRLSGPFLVTLYEQQLDMSESILGCRDVLHTQALPHHLKGNRVNIPQLGRGYCAAT